MISYYLALFCAISLLIQFTQAAVRVDDQSQTDSTYSFQVMSDNGDQSTPYCFYSTDGVSIRVSYPSSTSCQPGDAPEGSVFFSDSIQFAFMNGNDYQYGNLFLRDLNSAVHMVDLTKILPPVYQSNQSLSEGQLFFIKGFYNPNQSPEASQNGLEQSKIKFSDICVKDGVNQFCLKDPYSPDQTSSESLPEPTDSVDTFSIAEASVNNNQSETTVNSTQNDSGPRNNSPAQMITINGKPQKVGSKGGKNSQSVNGVLNMAILGSSDRVIDLSQNGIKVPSVECNPSFPISVQITCDQPADCRAFVVGAATILPTQCGQVIAAIGQIQNEGMVFSIQFQQTSQVQSDSSSAHIAIDYFNTDIPESLQLFNPIPMKGKMADASLFAGLRKRDTLTVWSKFAQWVEDATKVQFQTQQSFNIDKSMDFNFLDLHQKCSNTNSGTSYFVKAKCSARISADIQFGFKLIGSLFPIKITESYAYIRTRAGVSLTFDFDAQFVAAFEKMLPDISIALSPIQIPGVGSFGPQIGIGSKLSGQLLANAQLTSQNDLKLFDVYSAVGNLPDGQELQMNSKDPLNPPSANSMQIVKIFGGQDISQQAQVSLDGFIRVSIIPRIAIGFESLQNVVSAEIGIHSIAYLNLGFGSHSSFQQSVSSNGLQTLQTTKAQMVTSVAVKLSYGISVSPYATFFGKSRDLSALNYNSGDMIISSFQAKVSQKGGQTPNSQSSTGQQIGSQAQFPRLSSGGNTQVFKRSKLAKRNSIFSLGCINTGSVDQPSNSTQPIQNSTQPGSSQPVDESCGFDQRLNKRNQMSGQCSMISQKIFQRAQAIAQKWKSLMLQQISSGQSADSAKSFAQKRAADVCIRAPNYVLGNKITAKYNCDMGSDYLLKRNPQDLSKIGLIWQKSSPLFGKLPGVTFGSYSFRPCTKKQGDQLVKANFEFQMSLINPNGSNPIASDKVNLHVYCQ